MTFRHSGKLGDIVYSLAAARCVPGSGYLVHADGSRLSPEIAAAAVPLLRAQPYLDGAGLWAGEPVDHDFDGFRRLDPVFQNLADCHLATLGLPGHVRDRRWLFVGSAASLARRPVVFARSATFPGAPGVMEGLYRRFGRSATFVGTESEHGRFCAEVGPIDLTLTPDLLSLAEVIAGCRLFVGNQSCPLAIAEGLKVPVLQVVCPSEPNCVFYREDAHALWSATQLPSAAREMAHRVGLE